MTIKVSTHGSTFLATLVQQFFVGCHKADLHGTILLHTSGKNCIKLALFDIV